MQRLDRLFKLRYGHSLELNAIDQVQAPAGLNFVSRAMRNNGVTARVSVDVVPAKAGELSVALGGNGVLSTFVQPEPFVCGRDVMVLTPRDSSMPLVEKLWWARCIWENRHRFSYGRQANRTLGSLLVPSAVPSWVRTAQVPSHDGLSQSAGPYVALENPAGNVWKQIRLDCLFEIRKGRRVTKADRVSGQTRFVGASEFNNGITDLAGLPAVFQANTITVAYNGSVGSAFYQDQPYFACDDVNVLVPRAPMSRWALLFVATVIRHERTRYTYGYKWTLSRMNATKIRLPTNQAGNPYWEYIDRFMQGLPFSAAVELGGLE